ncbi:hypothetical protein [Streptomyces ipomoeae]|uniref:hypothetical protein n=1 Tax=Streptomyces ipomoeae TaxID=103232 RepID=UPI0011479694|nr:hypothetical protein [Streptomyces ipomoeae]TQE33090.1 hypothetical protein Sipo7851_21550 [Streptomyces ipomoeae]
MTKDKKRKSEIREAKRTTGSRYARLAREMKQTAQPAARTFRLAELLAECATLPPASVDWGFPEEYAPAVFASSLLGGGVPYGTVLELSGALAKEGPRARVTLESMSPQEEAVVVCHERRFLLVLTQDMVNELCRTPGCSASPVNWAITWCARHLPGCDTQTLVRMARNWGHGRREDLDRDPARLGESPEADLLIKAAVAQGAFERVRKVLLDACFGDPDLFDDEFWDASEALAMQHALERERLRLYEVALAEGLRIRGTAGSCTTCGERLHGWNPDLPPQFCASCAPPPPADHRLLLAMTAG